MTNPRGLIPCTYVGQKGPCTKLCYRGRCHIHRKKESLTLCSRCGKFGTRSKTGICATIATGCRWAAQVRSKKLKAEVDDMDAYVDALIESFDASTNVPPCPPQ